MFDISRDDAEQLAAKLKRIKIADLIEKMEVSVVPFAIKKHEICSIYKLKIKLYDPELYPPHTDITLEDCHNTLIHDYMREMEAALKSHLLLLSRICGIKSDSQPKDSDEMDEAGFGSKSQTEGDDDGGDDDDEDDEEGGDQSSKTRKRKEQTTDEVDYEGDSEDEVEEGNHVSERENEVELGEDKDEDEDEDEDGKESLEQPSGPDSQEQKEKPETRQRKTSDDDKAIYVNCDELYFEVHFKLSGESHILMAQVCWYYKNVYFRRFSLSSPSKLFMVVFT